MSGEAMPTRIDAIVDIMSAYESVAEEYAVTDAEAKRTLEEGRAALRALGVTDAELRRASVG